MCKQLEGVPLPPWHHGLTGSSASALPANPLLMQTRKFEQVGLSRQASEELAEHITELIGGCWTWLDKK